MISEHINTMKDSIFLITLHNTNMKNPKNILIIVGLSITVGCMSCAEPYTTYNATLNNSTSVSIKILPYKSGLLVTEKADSIIKDGTLNIGAGIDRGMVNHGGFNSDLLSNMDSIIIIYDDNYQAIHYNNNPEIKSIKSILSENNRNIFNYLNYDYSFSDKSRYIRNALYNFTFTEADYEYAKE